MRTSKIVQVIRLKLIIAGLLCWVGIAKSQTLITTTQVDPCIGEKVTYTLQFPVGCVFDKWSIGSSFFANGIDPDYCEVVSDSANVITVRWLKSGAATVKATSTGTSSNCRRSAFLNVNVIEFGAPMPDTLYKAFCSNEDIYLSVPGLKVPAKWYDENNDVANTSGTFLRTTRPLGTYTFRAEVTGKYARCSPDSINKTVFVVTVATVCDRALNWIETTGYDGQDVPIAQSKSYFDLSGRALQSQAKIFSTGDIMASQSLRDFYGREVLTTLSAPTLKQEFQYVPYFLETADKKIYNAADFDAPENRYSPTPLGDGTPGTLGWYYSGNNSMEKYVPKTQYPYSRSEFYDDGSGEARRSAGPGEAFRLGSGHETLSGTFPVFAELNDYIQRRDTVFLGLRASGSLKNQGVQTVSRDANGLCAVAVTDKESHTIMTARAGTPDNYVLSVPTTVVSSNDSTSSSYRRMTYFYLLHSQVVSITGSRNYEVENLITNERKPQSTQGASFAGPDGKWPVGFYRVLLPKKGAQTSQVGIGYTNYYQDVSYQFYDDAGKLRVSVSPNGYRQWKTKGTPYKDIDKTLSVYNFRGWLLSTTEPDAGTTEYVYRKDGKIRFSRNAEQAAGNRYSYTHYDASGRPIESGEYLGTDVPFVPMTSLDFVGSTMDVQREKKFSEVTWTGNKQDWVRTYYDYPAADFYDDTKLSPAEYKQTFLRGAVSKTENEHIKTWYSYDGQGRVSWMAQKPAYLHRVFVSTYTYDLLGNVLISSSLAYDDSTATPLSEFHHHYTYDADKRLHEVYTSLTKAGQKKLRATYEYYLLGPLKRIELGEGLQGLDFVYNLQGWLTQINHPDPAQDPGRDGSAGEHGGFGKDVFGMILNYYESEFSDLFQIARLNPNKRGIHDLVRDPLMPDMSAIKSAFVMSAGQSLVGAFSPVAYSAAKPLMQEMINHFMADKERKLEGYHAYDAGGTSFEKLPSPEEAVASANTGMYAPGDKRYLVDFGNPGIPTVPYLFTSDYWNNMTAGNTGASLLNLYSTGEEASTIGIYIVKNASNGYGNGDYFNSEGFPGPVGYYPLFACTDSFFAYGPGGTYKLTGLSANKYYTLTVFGSRRSSTFNRTGAYTINGRQLTLDAANNNLKTITFHNVRPDASGEIILDFGVASGSQFGYINVLDLLERSAPDILAPANLTATLTARKGNLTWTDNVNNELGFHIERRKSGDDIFERIATTEANVTTFSDLGVSVGNSYEYRICAYNGSEESPYGNTASLSVPGVPDKRFLVDFGNPAVTTKLAGWNNANGGLVGNVSWDLQDTQGVYSDIDIEVVKNPSAKFAGDSVYYNTNGYIGVVGDYPVTACQDSYFAFGIGGIYDLKGLDPDKLYTIKLFGSRTSSKNDRTTFYKINGVRQTLETANNTSKTVTFHHMIPDEEGKIRMEWGVEEGSFLGYLNVMDISEVTNPIVDGPGNLQALGTLSGVKLTWTDVAVNETSYKIERKAPSDAVFTTIGQVSPNVTSFTDGTVMNGTEYQYRITAAYDKINSAYSNVVSLITPGTQPNRRYLIDFGSAQDTTGAPGWNNITSAQTGYTLSSIIDTKGNTSAISMQIVKVASNGFGNGDVFNINGYDGAVGDYPASACRDSYFAYGPGGTYKLKGLNPNRFYSIIIFGSRTKTTTNPTRVGTYTIDGKQVTLVADDNNTLTTTFHNLVANAAGELELAFGVANGSTHGYLGVMDIRETGTPAVVAPTQLAVQVDGRFANLTWIDQSTNETGFRVERRASDESIFKEVASVGPGITQFTDGLLSTGLSFEYRVVSHLADTLSAYSNTVSVSIPGVPARRFLLEFGSPDTGFPTTVVPGWNNLTDAGTGAVVNNLIDSKAVASSIGFIIVRNASNGYGSVPHIPFNTNGPNVPLFTYPTSACRDSFYAYASGGVYKLTGLNPAYYYTIKIFGSRDATANPDLTRVGSYVINGEKKTLNAASNRTETITFKQVVPNKLGEIILDFGVEAGSVLGYLNVMDFIESSVPDLTPPVLRSSERLAGNAGVRLTWADNTAYESGYEVYRATSLTGVFALLTTTAANATVYTDATAGTGQMYYYRLRAVGALGMSPYSNTLISDNTEPPSLAALANETINTGAIKNVSLVATAGGNLLLDRKNIVIMGSSSAEGYGATAYSKAWAGLMTEFIGAYNAGFNVVNIAKFGFNSTKLLASGDAEHNITKALSYNPLLIVINLPSNDQADGIPAATMIANLSTIKQQAEAAGVRVLVTTTQPRGQLPMAGRLQLQQAAATMLTTFGAAAIDVYNPLVNPADQSVMAAYSYGDGIHLNNAGHGMLFQLIKPKVEFILNKTQLEFTTTNAPAFVRASTLGNGQGQLSIKPGFGQKGAYNNVMVSVVDKNGNYNNQLLNIVVDEVDDAPDPEKLLKPLYNGLISATSWRTDSPSEGAPLTGMYRYEYDSSYQIKNAEWGDPNFQDSRFERQGNRYRLAGMRYDANGNIQALHRYDENGYHTDVFAYHYAAHKNQLQDVTGYTSNANTQQHGFVYNRIGQMVMADKLSGEDQFVEYDVTGKVKAVYRDANKTLPRIRNYYSDRGFRLAKVTYPEQPGADSLTVTTWYVHDASGTVLSIYEQKGAPDLNNVHPAHEKEIPVYGAGKLGTLYPLQDASMAYEITDHLGNVRALIRDNVNIYVATMEDSEEEATANPRVEEMQYFENLFSTDVSDARMNHTPAVPGREENPDKAAYLYWIGGNQQFAAADKAVGPSIALKVRPGDKISLKTWARYEEREDYTSDVTLALFAQFLGTDLGTMPGLDGLPVSNPTGVFESALAGLPAEGEDATQPRAFLNYIVFDENMVGVAAHRVQVSDLAGFDASEIAAPAGLEELQDSVEITTNGYIYVWVSNGSEGTKVWFDDLTVVHTGGVVTQAADYGVWGDVLREEKLDETKYRFGYQGQFAERDEETGWNHFELREYDPVVGRWTARDPMHQYHSPYKAMGNNPVNSFDPNGGTDGYSNGPNDWYYNAAEGLIYKKGVKGDIMGYSWVADDDATYEQIRDNLLFVAPNFAHFESVFWSYARPLAPVSDAANLWSDLADLNLGIAEGTILETIETAKVGSLGAFGTGLLSSYKWVGRLGTASTIVGYVSTSTSLIFDYHAYKMNNISGYRFTWRTVGNFASIGIGTAVGSSLGGPLGAVAGGAVGGGFWAAEQVYDGLRWYGKELSKGAVNFQNNGSSFFR
jgi:RHS repeat-associated protein